jgi:hypothetical protein
VVASDLLAHHLERLVASLEHQWHWRGKIEAAKALDARLDFLRFGLVNAPIVDDGISASAEGEHQQREES